MGTKQTLPFFSTIAEKFSQINPITRAKKKSVEAVLRLIAGSSNMMRPENYHRFVMLHNLHIWVYRCNQVLVNAAMRVTPKQYSYIRKNGTLLREELADSHPAAKILSYVNPWDTYQDLVEKQITSLSLTGQFYIHFDKDRGELHHLRSDRVTILPDAKQYIRGFNYEVDGQPTSFARDEIIFCKYYNPNDDYYGLSPLKAAANSINSHLKASKWNLAFFDNHALPMGLLVSENSSFVNDKEELDLIKKEWVHLFGGWDKFGDVGVVGGGLKYQPITPTHTEMNFGSLLDKSRDEIASAYGVPPIFLNDQEKANYANLREFERMLWRHTMIPKLIKLQGIYDKFLNPYFAEKNEIIRTEFDLTQVEALRDDIVAEAQASQILVSSGQRLVDEARAKRGEAPMPNGEGEVSFVPMSFVRLDQAGAVLDGRSAPGGETKSRLALSSQLTRRLPLEKSVLPTKELRLRHWVKTKSIVTTNQNRVERVLIALFSDLEEEMLRNIRNIGKAYSRGEKAPLNVNVESLIYDLESATELLVEAGSPILADTLESGGVRGMATVGAGTSFDLADPRVKEILERAVQRFKDDITPANWERIKTSLVEGLNSGETSKELAARVTANMGREINNAATIARTEVLPVYHQGQLEGFSQSGVVELKEWMSAFAEESREEHMEADGQTTDLNGFFYIPPDYLQYPGDSSGSAENIINCLCDVLPVIREE